MCVFGSFGEFGRFNGEVLTSLNLREFLLGIFERGLLFGISETEWPGTN